MPDHPLDRRLVSYRELLAGESFGPRRKQLLDAFALLLAEVHLLGRFWGDCSLSNVLYRYDAGAIETNLVDGETASIYDTLSDARRQHDIEIMVENAASEMADIAAQQGVAIDNADLNLGEGIASPYQAFLRELRVEERIADDEQYRITERIDRLHELGFEVDEIRLVPHHTGEHVHSKPGSPTATITRTGCASSPESRRARTKHASCSLTCAISK